MGVVSLRQTGLIYEDTFDNASLDPRWEVSPTDQRRRGITGGSLYLYHGTGPTYLFFTPLTDLKQFIMDVQNVYNPVTADDMGGVIVYAGESDFISLEEYYDAVKGSTMTYPWLRLVRNYNSYSAYWSEDGALWNLIGTQDFYWSAPKIGLYLKGAAGQNLEVQSVRIYSSSKVEIGNLSSGVQVELLDTAGAVVKQGTSHANLTSVELDVSDLAIPFIGKFRIRLADNVTYLNSTDTYEVWGGDYFTFEPNVDLYYLDELAVEHVLNEGFEEYLGYIKQSDTQYKQVQVIARNHMTSGTLNNVTVVPAQYHGTDHYQRLVKLCPDASGVPGAEGTSVLLGTLAVNGEARFWLRIYRETVYLNIREYAYFGLSVTSTYTS